MLMLESLDSAKARKAHIYAELTGFGMSGDAYHMTSPPEDGRGAARSMANALRDSGLNAADVGRSAAQRSGGERSFYAPRRRAPPEGREGVSFSVCRAQ